MCHGYRFYSKIMYEHFIMSTTDPNTIIITDRYNPLLPANVTNTKRIKTMLNGTYDNDFKLLDSYIAWRELPNRRCYTKLDIDIVKELDGEEKDRFHYKIVKDVITKMDSKLSCQGTGDPELYHIDAAKYTYQKKRLTLFDMANCKKFRLIYPDNANLNELVFWHLRLIYWKLMSSEHAADGSTTVETVVFYPLCRPSIRFNLLSKSLIIDEKEVWSFVNPGGQLGNQPGNQRVVPTAVRFKPSLLHKDQGGRPPVFGLTPNVITQRTKAKKPIQQSFPSENSYVDSKELLFINASTVELYGKIFKFRRWQAAKQEKVYTRAQCDQCKLTYDTASRRWSGNLNHMRECRD
jgi:hypothetical protein